MFHFAIAAMLLAATPAQDDGAKLLAAAKADGLSAEEIEIATGLDTAFRASSGVNGHQVYREALVKFYKRGTGDAHKTLVHGAACWHARWYEKEVSPIAPAKFLWGWIKPANAKRCPE